MIKQFSSLLLLRWVSFVRSAAVAVLVAVFALAFFAMRYTVDNLSMSTDTEDMLSEELVWRKLDQEYEKRFPQYDNNILIVVEAATPDQAGTPPHYSTSACSRNRHYSSSCITRMPCRCSGNPACSISIRRNSRTCPTASPRSQPFLAKLARDPSLRGLFGVLAEALDAREDGEDIDLNPILTHINAAIEALQDNRPFRMSWQELMSGDNPGDASAPGAGAEKATYREFIVLQPKLDYAGFFPATPAIEKIHRLYEDLDLATSPGAQIRLTGATVLAHEEMLSVMKGTKTAIVLALALVTVIMLVGLGSVRLALVTMISLVTGLLFTAAFATLTVGELNLISVAFAVLYIGLGVDFAIHYCLRYGNISSTAPTGAAHWSRPRSTSAARYSCARSAPPSAFCLYPHRLHGRGGTRLDFRFRHVHQFCGHPHGDTGAAVPAAGQTRTGATGQGMPAD